MKRTATTRDDNVTVPFSRPIKAKKSSSEDGFLSDPEAGLLYLQGLVPSSKFGNDLPRIVLKHQIYSIIKDKTAVDREIMSMRNNGRLRLIKLDSSGDDYAIVTTEQYCQLITDKLGACPLRTKVIDTLLPQCVDVSVSKVQLIKELCFTDDEISVLVKQGLLLVRDVGKYSSWWFTIPGISGFKSDFAKGRSAVKLMFKRAKNNELLQKDLEAKKISGSSLPMEYYIHDLVGSEFVESIDTSSGPLLKLLL